MEHCTDRTDAAGFAADFACRPAINSSLFDLAGNQLKTPNLSSIQWDWQSQNGSISYPDPQDATATVSEYCVYAPGGGQRVRKIRETVSAQGLITRLAITEYLGNTERRSDYVQTDPAVSIGYDGETVSNAAAQKDYSELRVRLGHAQSARLLSGKLSAEGPQDESRSYFDLSNYIDSVQMELDEAGAISSHQSYYPFGGTAASADGKDQTGLDLKHYQYSGQEKDNSGLYYYGYRYYDPSALRWTRPDPAGATGSGFNWYAMVSNNPVTHRDVMGLAEEDHLIVGFLRPFVAIDQCTAVIRIIAAYHYEFNFREMLPNFYMFLHAFPTWNIREQAIFYDFDKHKADIYFITENHAVNKHSWKLLKNLKAAGIVGKAFYEFRERQPVMSLRTPLELTREGYYCMLHCNGLEPLERHQSIMDMKLSERCKEDIDIQPRLYWNLAGALQNEVRREQTVSDAIRQYSGVGVELLNYAKLYGRITARRISAEMYQILTDSERMMLTALEHYGGKAVRRRNQRNGAISAAVGMLHVLENFGELFRSATRTESNPRCYLTVESVNDYYIDQQLFSIIRRSGIEPKIRIFAPAESMDSVFVDGYLYFAIANNEVRPFRVTGPYRLASSVFFEIETSATVGGRRLISRPGGGSFRHRMNINNSNNNNENNPSNQARRNFDGDMQMK